MILELEVEELVGLLQSEQALMEKSAQAFEVLQKHQETTG